MEESSRVRSLFGNPRPRSRSPRPRSRRRRRQRLRATPAPASPAPVGPRHAPRPSRPQAAKTYTIGYSNGGGVGNGFREEQVCTAKAQAKASGQVSTSP